MRKFLLIIPLLILIALGGAFLWWKNTTSAPGEDSLTHRIVINRGAGAGQIANKLETSGVIKNEFTFRVYLQVKGLTKSIPPGEFRIPGNISVGQVVEILLAGPTELWVGIPEGLRREQYPEIFIESLEKTGEEARQFRVEFLAASAGQEGYLFPDTYLFPPDVDGSTAVVALTANFDRRFDEAARASLAQNTDFSVKQAVTLASIIERETRSVEERPTVAGIFINRLEIGMALQADATAQYALGTPGNWWPKGLTRTDLQINSPFNTYVIGGLPPAPIANPGLTSLLAVVNPMSSDFFYYLHDPSGQIHYGRTLDEHNQNVAEYLR